MTIKPLNRTAVANSFLFWANPAVHVDSTYQVIFPPSVQYVTFHAKRDMTAWPIADSWFNNYNYTGLNVSYWKNTRVPSSFFSWDPQEDYFGGYDHGKDAGTVWVGNHHRSPGMKYWADGNNEAGRKINRGLTDNDGRYIELMAGFYTDNQPDYSWLQPYESKYGTMTWFPVRELGGLKYANVDGALNMEITNQGSLDLRINTTSPHQNATMVVLAGGETVTEKTIDIGPAQPFAEIISLPEETKEYDLKVTLKNSNDEILLTFAPVEYHLDQYPKPEPLKPLPKPAEIKTVEELYLTGLRLNQFYNAYIDPMSYYQEALARDPGNYNVNTQLGILAIKNYDWETAENHLQTAVDRITANYTRPKDGEALYYLAVAQREQGKMKEAYDNFYRASWSNAWHTASYYQLAEMDCLNGNFESALDNLNRSLSTNVNNVKALNLKAVVLRKMNRLDDAEQQAQASIDTMIINHMASNELVLIARETSDNAAAEKRLDELARLMRNEVQSYLELATDYGNCGFNDEAIGLLSRLEKTGENFPMLYYYLGYYWHKSGNQEKAKSYYLLANTKPHTYCFPFRSESVSVLTDAIQLNPNDSKAFYYLGNLLYEKQPERAIAAWEKSRQLDDSFYIVHRNLAIAYKEVDNDFSKALQSMQKALAQNSNDPRLLFELDELNNLNKVSPKEKYEVLKENKETAKMRSETLLRLATRAVEYGKYQEAIDIFNNNEIDEFEGSREMQNTYLDAYGLRGLEHLTDGEYAKALEDFNTCLSYPIGLYGRTSFATYYYLAGEAFEKMRHVEEAEEYYKKVLDIESGGRRSSQEYLYYRGLALYKLGKADEARTLYQKMLDDLKDNENNSQFFAQFGNSQSADNQRAENHYLMGLAYKGLGETENAKTEFKKAIELNPGHIWSKVHLKLL